MAHEKRPTDPAYSTDDPGMPMVAVRQDTPTALAADGRYHPLLVDANGRLHVILPLPTNAAQETGGNLATLASGIYATGAIPATPTGMLANGLVGDTSPYYVDTEVRPISLTNDGRLRVASVPARQEAVFFNPDEERMWGTLEPDYTYTGSPWTDW